MAVSHSPARSAAGPEGLLVTVARTFAEVEAARDSYSRFAPAHVEGDLDMFLARARARDEVERPYVLSVTREGILEAVMLGTLERITLDSKLGYNVLRRRTLRAIRVPPGGVLAADRTDLADAIISKLLEELRQGTADVVCLLEIPAESLLDTALYQRTPRIRRHTVRHKRWRLDVDREGSELLASWSLKTRKNVARARRRLQDQFGAGIDLAVLHRPKDWDRVLAVLHTIGAQSVTKPLGIGFQGLPGELARIELGLDRGSFRVFVLSLDGAPSAYWAGFLHRGVFYGTWTAYVAGLAAYRIGSYTLVEMLEQLCSDPDVHQVDFGFGDAHYKAAVSDQSSEEEIVYLFAPTLRAISANVMHSALTATGAVLLRAFGERGVRRIRRAWRRRLLGASRI